ncbi:MAG: hypothetical protein HC890_13440 [Chloroflexaceae bacterium]|nr:hypothetical protein [Chloroflexaceae bacterium]
MSCSLPSLAAVPGAGVVSDFALEAIPAAKPLARPALPVSDRQIFWRRSGRDLRMS